MDGCDWYESEIQINGSVYNTSGWVCYSRGGFSTLPIVSAIVGTCILLVVVGLFVRQWSKHGRRRFDINLREFTPQTGSQCEGRQQETYLSRTGKNSTCIDVECYNNGFIIENEEQSVRSEINHKSTHYRRCIEKAEIWSKKMIILGDYDQQSFSLPFFCAGIFDKHGGKLHFNEAGVSLLIPPGAIQQSTPQLIYIYLHHDQNDILPIPPNTMTTSPVVFCGPSGIKFGERVILSYQHCANITNNNINLVTLRTETEPDQSPSFYNLSEDNDSMTLIKGNTVTLLLPHFTGHTSVVQYEQKEESVPIIQEKWLDLMLFSSQIKEGDYDLQLRLYCTNQTQDARYFVLEDERLLNGSLCLPSMPFLFASISDVNVLLNSEGDWTVRGGKNKQVIAKKCLFENARIPCVYHLEHDQEKTVTKLKCQVNVSQDGREELFGKIIDVLVRKQQGIIEDKMPRSLVQVVRRNLLLPYPLRECIRKKLDIDSSLGNDWRNLAYHLGYDDCIQQWEEQLGQHQIHSPTKELLNVWEAGRSGHRTTDLNEIIEIFKRMERLDIVSEIDKWNVILINP